LINKQNDFSRQFEVEPPSTVLALLKTKNTKAKFLEQHLEKMIPELLADFGRIRPLSKVRFYETPESFVQVLEEFVTQSGGEIWCLGSPKILDFSPEVVEWYIQNRRKNNIISHSIMFENQTLRKRDQARDLRPIKWIPSQFNNDTAVIAYGNKTAIWNTVYPKIIVIEDTVICEFFKPIFSLIWEKLE